VVASCELYVIWHRARTLQAVNLGMSVGYVLLDDIAFLLILVNNYFKSRERDTLYRRWTASNHATLSGHHRHRQALPRISSRSIASRQPSSYAAVATQWRPASTSQNLMLTTTHDLSMVTGQLLHPRPALLTHDHRSC